MKRALIIAGALCLVAFGAQRRYSSRQTATFVAGKKAEFAGYRVEHLERERLLFLHRPDGTRSGVSLAELQGVFLNRLNAADATDNKNHYSWVMAGPPIAIEIPYFAIEPTVMLAILKKEYPAIDSVKSLRLAKDFEHDKFSVCTIWAIPGSPAARAAPGYSACASER